MNNFFMSIATRTFIKIKMTYRNSKYIPNNQYIQYNKNGEIFGEYDKDKLLSQYEFIKNKRLISISPGGYKGIYTLGTCMYIREHFNLEDFIYSGASAGAWNSLFMCYKKNAIELKENVVDDSLIRSYTLNQIELNMKDRILQHYSIDDFDLRRLFIGVTTINTSYRANTTIFSGFTSLEDAINCCIASSHIPLITGGIINKYNNVFSFDGGFSKYPYLNILQPALHVTPSMWKSSINKSLDINDYTTIFLRKRNFTEMYLQGYLDAKKNNDFLYKSLTIRDS